MQATMPPADPGDGQAELADRIARGLPGLDRFVRQRMGPHLRDLESASDIVQSTARELLRSGSFVDRGAGSFERWLRGAAENKLRNRARYWQATSRQAARSTTALVQPPDQGCDAPSRVVALEEERHRLTRAVSRLPEEHRLVLRRVQMEGASYGEVGRELGRSSEATRKLAARALARLSTLLGPE